LFPSGFSCGKIRCAGTCEPLYPARCRQVTFPAAAVLETWSALKSTTDRRTDWIGTMVGFSGHSRTALRLRVRLCSAPDINTFARSKKTTRKSIHLLIFFPRELE